MIGFIKARKQKPARKEFGRGEVKDQIDVLIDAAKEVVYRGERGTLPEYEEALRDLEQEKVELYRLLGLGRSA